MAKRPEIRMAFDEVPAYPLVCEDEHLTHQEFKDETDIHKIVARASVNGGQLPQLVGVDPMFGDFTGIMSPAEAIDFGNKARDKFLQLDPKIRERFSNRPEKLIEFLKDKNNKAEAISLGLIPKPEVKPEPAPVKVMVVNQDAPKT